MLFPQSISPHVFYPISAQRIKYPPSNQQESEQWGPLWLLPFLKFLCLVISQIISCHLASAISVLFYYLNNETQFLIDYMAMQRKGYLVQYLLIARCVSGSSFSQMRCKWKCNGASSRKLLKDNVHVGMLFFVPSYCAPWLELRQP